MLHLYIKNLYEENTWLCYFTYLLSYAFPKIITFFRMKVMITADQLSQTSDLHKISRVRIQPLCVEKKSLLLFRTLECSVSQ